LHLLLVVLVAQPLLFNHPVSMGRIVLVHFGFCQSSSCCLLVTTSFFIHFMMIETFKCVVFWLNLHSFQTRCLVYFQLIVLFPYHALISVLNGLVFDNFIV